MEVHLLLFSFFMIRDIILIVLFAIMQIVVVISAMFLI